MSDPLIQGAMKAVKDSAGRITDAVDAERFGGKARPRTLRGVPTDVRVLNGKRIASDDGGKSRIRCRHRGNQLNEYGY